MKQYLKFRLMALTWLLIMVFVSSSVSAMLAQTEETDVPYRGYLPLVAGTKQSAGNEATESEAVESEAGTAGNMVNTGQKSNPKVDQIIVRLHKSAHQARSARAAQVSALSAAIGLPLRYQREMSGDAIVVKLPNQMSEAEVQLIAKQLAQLPAVELAQPDWILQRQLTPNDPRYPSQWHYFAPVANAYGINLPSAWDITTGSPDVVIAVLDTGIISHPDLNGRTVAGYDFITNLATANDGDGRDANPTDPGDWCGVDPSSWHGAHVAGTIGAKSNNSSGVAGVNWQSKIQPVRVLGVCGGTFSDIVDAIRWSAGLSVPDVPDNATPAKVINMSLGGSGSCEPMMQSAIDDAVNAGTVVAVAAGNSSSDALSFQPANCNGILTVAATTRTGNMAWYSNFGATVEISAPGGETNIRATDGVLSTLNMGTTVPLTNTYRYYQGTSMATPHVAGVASLLFSLRPDLTPAQVQLILQATATAFPSGSTCTPARCGSGIVNATAALLLAQAGFFPPANLRATTLSTAEIELTWNDNSVDETGFQIERCQGVGCTSFSLLTTVGPNVTTYTDGGLSADTSYGYRVRAVKIGAESFYTNRAAAATLAAGCALYHSTNVPKTIADTTTVESTLAVLDNFAIGDVNVANLQILHTYNNDLIALLVSPAGLEVELFGRIGGSDDNFVQTRFDDSAPQAITDGAAPFTGSYRPTGWLGSFNGQASNGLWRLRITDTTLGDLGELLGWSLELCRAPAALPAAPTQLSARSFSSSQIVLTWEDNAVNETGFRIDRCRGANCTDFVEVATVGPNVVGYTATGLVVNTTYRHRVRAYGVLGDSDYTNISDATTGPRPPGGLQGTVVSNRQIDLAWTDNATNELGFRVERCVNAGCTSFVHIATLAANSTTYQNVGLAPGVTYRYRVRSYNSAGNSSYSGIVTRTTSSSSVVAAAATQSSPELVQGAATYHADDESGALTIVTAAEGAFTLTQGAACRNGVQPAAVTLAIGSQRLLMTADTAKAGLYTAAAVAQNFTAGQSYPVELTWACDGAEGVQTTNVGTLTIATTDDDTTTKRFQYLPLIAQ